MQVPVYSLTGEVVRQIEVSDHVFAAPFNEAVVHQVMVGQRANARQGTASTKTRGKIAGSTRKLFRQKGTGYARAGSKKSPLRRGGGVTFGPHPAKSNRQLVKKSFADPGKTTRTSVQTAKQAVYRIHRRTTMRRHRLVFSFILKVVKRFVQFCRTGPFAYNPARRGKRYV